MDPRSIYFYATIRPKIGVLQTFAGPREQYLMLYHHRVPYLEVGRTSRAVTP